LSLVTDAKNKAQKDNDIVYNEVVPSETSLAPIEKGKDVAEPIPIHDVYASPDVQKIVGPNLFSKLVPLSVHESASLYSEEKAKLVRAEAERADLADGELAAALEYMGLPASLERFRPGAAGQDGLTDPGAQVRGWAEEVRREESQGRVDDLFKKLATLKESAAKQLETASRDLEVESRECESMRVRYGHLWEQQPSSSFTRSYRQDIRSHRESLEQAAASDGQAQGLWEGIRRDVFLLHESSGAALERAFVEAVGTTGQAKEASLLDGDFGEDEEEEIKEHVASISEALSKLSKVKKERNDVLKDLKERVRSISSFACLPRVTDAACRTLGPDRRHFTPPHPQPQRLRQRRAHPLRHRTRKVPRSPNSRHRHPSPPTNDARRDQRRFQGRQRKQEGARDARTLGRGRTQ
jgi:tyrosine-protein phosphatase non-receptor type 23